MQKKRKDWDIIQSFHHLARLMRKQQGKCHWCKRDMVLLRSVSGDRSIMADNVATKDHVHARSIKKRHGKVHSEIVLACFRCNNDRSFVQSQLTMELTNYTPFVKYLRSLTTNRRTKA